MRVGGRCACVSNILDHECLLARRPRAAPGNRREAGQARTDPSVRISANLSSVALSEYTCEPGAASPAARQVARREGSCGPRRVPQRPRRRRARAQIAGRPRSP